ncbi:Pet127-domain-containing protein [Tothia fuscella]|uniref:Pet127-domain-containing protein n=1 Tax=Tothia fuscella TaxID=1048955 RepID=A0A9P4NF78_9PEZI|nr:Pet127-domain-containing protein [Tothia fuscella]
MLSAFHRPVARSSVSYVCLTCRLNRPSHRRQTRHLTTEHSLSSPTSIPPLPGVKDLADIAKDGALQSEQTKSVKKKKRKKAGVADGAATASISEILPVRKEADDDAQRSSAITNEGAPDKNAASEPKSQPRKVKGKGGRIRNVNSRNRRAEKQEGLAALQFQALAQLLKGKNSQENKDSTAPEIRKYMSESPETPIDKARWESIARRLRRDLRDVSKSKTLPPENVTFLKRVKTLREALLAPRKRTRASRTAKKAASNSGPASFTPKAFKLQEQIKKIDVKLLKLQALDIPQPRVPGLSYGLDRVLFNSGVYQLQDPRSRVYNFDPYLEKIIPSVEFDFAALKPYRISSEDQTLGQIAKKNGFKYYSSTSSLTSVLQHFHYLLSDWKPINLKMLSKGFDVATGNQAKFSAFQRSPFSIFLRARDGAYAIDSDKSNDTGNPLSLVGKVLEKLFTVPKKDFEQFRINRETGQSEAGIDRAPESFHYTGVGNVLVRSQLDAYDSRLPGNGIYDIKTRAVLPIRMDSKGKLENSTDYEIRSAQGDFESYEREFFDMSRATLLKYSLQVRLGRMDGIFVAYHNIRRLFGFQYLSIQEMDKVLHHSTDRALGDDELKASLTLLNEVLERVAARFPNQSCRLHFETNARASPFMHIFAEPMTEEQIEKIQDVGRKKVHEAEKILLTPHVEGDAVENESSNEQSSVEELAHASGETRSKLEDEVTAIEQAFKDEPREIRDFDSDGTERPVTARILDLQNLSLAILNKCADLDGRLTSENAHTNLRTIAEISQDLRRLHVGIAKIRDEIPKEEPRDSGESDPDYQMRKEHWKQVDLLSDVLVELKVKNLRILRFIKAAAKEVQSPDTGVEETTEEQVPSEATKPREVLALALSTRSIRSADQLTDGTSFEEGKTEPGHWTIEYCLEEVEDASLAFSIYDACKKRRDTAGMGDKSDEALDRWFKSGFMREIARYATKGGVYRKERDAMDRELGEVVMFEEGKGEGSEDLAGVAGYMQWLYDGERRE